MELHTISFYEEFSCAAATCIDNCCKGWRIPLDPASLEKYEKEKGVLGFKLNKAIEKDVDIYVFNSKANSCPFWGRDKLCSLQCEKGEEYMPMVCRRYPRRTLNYGAFCEFSLELACPVVAKLFLAHQKDFSYKLSTIEDDLAPTRHGTNDDWEFLQMLLSSRDNLNHYIFDLSHSDESLYFFLLQYGRKAQEACISGHFTFFEEDLTPFTSFDGNFSFSSKAIDLLITNGLYHIKLKSKAPLLYDLCKCYFKLFDKLTFEEAEVFFTNSYQELLSYDSTLSYFFRSYLVYYMNTSYLEVFEHYSFLKTICQGLIHVTLVKLFFTIFFHKNGHLTTEDQAKILSTYEKRARHNEDIMDLSYQAVYAFLP